MRIALDPEQVALKEELQGYFRALVTPEVKAGLASATGEFGDAGVYKAVIKPARHRRVARHRLARGVGRPEPLDDGPADLHRRGRRLRRTDPLPHPQHGRADDHALRDRRAEGRSSCRGSSRATCTSRSATPSRAPAPTSPRCKTRAVREGDEWVINGQKMWTTLIQYADYVWLACRTDPDVPRHKGLSMILVPTDVDGFSYTPVHTVAGVRPARRTTRTCACRPPTWSASSTGAGLWSPTSSTTSGSRSPRRRR